MKRAKISIIGAGNVGATTAHICALKELGDIVLLDIMEGIPQGKSLDMAESMPVEKIDSNILGTNDYNDIKNSDVVVITAGIPRKPGMSRDDLLKTNTNIVKTVSESVKKFSPNAILIIVSNPLDAMVYVAHKITGFSKKKVVGMAGILDSTRFAHFIAREIDVSAESVSALVMGGHGDQMIPLARFANVGGIPISHFIKKERIDAIVDRARKGGAEIVGLLKTGSAFYAPGSSVAEMVESIVRDKKKILPCAAYLDGEYGVSGLFIGVPVKLGKEGVEEVIEINLDKDEKNAFDANVKHVKELMEITGV